MKTSDTFNTNQHIFGKVYFPRIIVPISIIISNLLKLGIQFGLFIGIYVYYLNFTETILHINLTILLIPLLILIISLFGLGLGILITSLTTKYRDLKLLICGNGSEYISIKKKIDDLGFSKEIKIILNFFLLINFFFICFNDFVAYKVI